MVSKVRVLFIVLLLSISLSCLANDYVQIIQLRSGTPELKAECEAQIKQLTQLLSNQGVEVYLSQSAEEIKGDLATIAQTATIKDSFSLYVFGYASVNARRIVLSTANGRITAEELKVELENIKATQTLYLFNSGGAALAANLLTEHNTIISAQDSLGQLATPRYPSFYIQAITESPKADLKDILIKAGDYTRNFYKQNSLAISENSQILSSKAQSSYPFDDSARIFASTTTSTNSAKIEYSAIPTPSALNPATPESLKLIAEAAKKAPEFTEYPAFYLNRQADFILNQDKSGVITERNVIYINSKQGANLVAPGMIGGSQSAKIIYPDGSYMDINSGYIPTPPVGSILCLEHRQQIPRPTHLPEFQFIFVVQNFLPVCEFQITFPEELKYKFYNAEIKKSVADGKITLHSTQKLHAYEKLKFSAYPELSQARLVLTTLPDWAEFNQWMERMTNRSKGLDEEAKKFLDDLVKNSKSELDKVKAIYDYLNSLRYVTIPLGAASFRPQTTGDMLRNNYGDCKDKANALAEMCQELGIEAYRVLLNRNSAVDPEFAHWQFNHMIVYLPQYNLWLDPTDNISPFGELALGDAGSYGLILSPKPQFKLIEPAPSGHLSINMTINRSGSSQIEIETNGFATYEWERIYSYLPTPQIREVRIAEFLNEILPNSELISYTTDPKITLEATYNGGMVQLPKMLSSAFIPPTRTNPIRLFDGGVAKFSYQITFNDETFVSQQWNETSKYCIADLQVEGNEVKILFTLLAKAEITPEVYQEIRKTLYRLYREINLIQREQL